AAILLTLDARHPDAGLLPQDQAARAQALRWLLFVATEIYPMVEINDYPERFAPTPNVAPGVREVARARWRVRWQIVEAEIAGDPYLLSSGFCLTNLYFAVVSRWALQDEWRPCNLPKVEVLTVAVKKCPASAPVWARHRPDVSPDRFE
ncbi:MAG: glutathione S-transferase family protein, partial [Pseudomonadota bacterium]|nr:glutathione S-transferase family protein [Pseudomonadota bacterium]